MSCSMLIVCLGGVFESLYDWLKEVPVIVGWNGARGHLSEDFK